MAGFQPRRRNAGAAAGLANSHFSSSRHGPNDRKPIAGRPKRAPPARPRRDKRKHCFRRADGWSALARKPWGVKISPSRAIRPWSPRRARNRARPPRGDRGRICHGSNPSGVSVAAHSSRSVASAGMCECRRLPGGVLTSAAGRPSASGREAAGHVAPLPPPCRACPAVVRGDCAGRGRAQRSCRGAGGLAPQPEAAGRMPHGAARVKRLV